ncbi:MAG TPA: hypothetical protein DDX91_08985 [Ruminococcaceae bacterium]|nr:hypothetical protein [Oscillospiraceae bacterium]
MKKIRKITSAILAITMALWSNIICIAADNETENEEITVKDATEITDEFSATGEIISYVPKTRATSSVGAAFDKIDALSSDDAIDFYSFSVSSPRSVVFRFLSGNSNYTANLGALDTSNGNVTLSNLWLSPNDVKWSSELPAGNYCWVILSKSNTYTADKYRISMNALNTSGATQHIVSSATLAYSTFAYDDVFLMNGKNIAETAVKVASEISKFEDRLEGPSPTNTVATVTVNTDPKYICDSLFYGSYESTNPYLNLKTGMGHSTANAIFIPIDGSSMSCTYSTKYVPTELLVQQAVGILVYDLESNKIIDFMSPLNIFYANTIFNYTYEYTSYKEIAI